ncbi:hypothetical protein C1H76_1958 [Elsinoe australis]|uniref:Uncharacterized protein n=1 Tax=Elsinoe australis TaxID=40998 RepID=A0A4V6DUU7_9PEZI|nr:hypothetical protein C1H76_1958 [Elsinoe australis]
MPRLALPTTLLLLLTTATATPTITPAPPIPTTLHRRTAPTPTPDANAIPDIESLVSQFQSNLQAIHSTTLPVSDISSLISKYSLTSFPTSLLSSILGAATADPSAAIGLATSLAGDIPALISAQATSPPAAAATGIMAAHPDLYTTDGPKGPVGDRPGFGPENADSNGVYLDDSDCEEADREAHKNGTAVETGTATGTATGPGTTIGGATAAAGSEGALNVGPTVSWGDSQSPTGGNGDGQSAGQEGSQGAGAGQEGTSGAGSSGAPGTPDISSQDQLGAADGVNTTTPDGAPGGIHGGPGSENCGPQTITVTVTSTASVTLPTGGAGAGGGDGIDTPSTGDNSTAAPGDSANGVDNPGNSIGVPTDGRNPEDNPSAVSPDGPRASNTLSGAIGSPTTVPDAGNSTSADGADSVNNGQDAIGSDGAPGTNGTDAVGGDGSPFPTSVPGLDLPFPTSTAAGTGPATGINAAPTPTNIPGTVGLGGFGNGTAPTLTTAVGSPSYTGPAYSGPSASSGTGFPRVSGGERTAGSARVAWVVALLGVVAGAMVML